MSVQLTKNMIEHAFRNRLDDARRDVASYCGMVGDSVSERGYAEGMCELSRRIVAALEAEQRRATTEWRAQRDAPR